jgi:hypothetical protein
MPLSMAPRTMRSIIARPAASLPITHQAIHIEHAIVGRRGRCGRHCRGGGPGLQRQMPLQHGQHFLHLDRLGNEVGDAGFAAALALVASTPAVMAMIGSSAPVPGAGCGWR